MVPRFRGDNAWAPAFAGVTTQEAFYEPDHNWRLEFIENLGFKIGAISSASSAVNNGRLGR